jgi:hypothetical protein
VMNGEHALGGKMGHGVVYDSNGCIASYYALIYP